MSQKESLAITNGCEATLNDMYRQISKISRTESQILTVSRFVLLPLYNPLKPGV